jgi:hypothetical protein
MIFVCARSRPRGDFATHQQVGVRATDVYRTILGYLHTPHRCSAIVYRQRSECVRGKGCFPTEVDVAAGSHGARGSWIDNLRGMPGFEQGAHDRFRITWLDHHHTV